MIIRTVRRVLPTTKNCKLVIRRGSKRLVTPMLIVMVSIGTTDVLFALDSIPAIFGLTKEPYLVFTANAFALMGLRQLYFLIGGLLNRLVYLSYGLAIVLGFIGVKLILEALHTNEVPFINGGEPVPWAPEIPSGSRWWSSSAPLHSLRSRVWPRPDAMSSEPTPRFERIRRKPDARCRPRGETASVNSNLIESSSSRISERSAALV